MTETKGLEWIVEAHGCAASALRDLPRLKSLFSTIVADLGLHVIGEPMWYQFPVTAGITGLCLLSESHLACHTFPEHGSLCLNLFCCRERVDWPFERELRTRFAATEVRVRRFERPYTRATIAAATAGDFAR